MFVSIPGGWVAHASRVPAMASSPSRTTLDTLGFQQAPTTPNACFGGTPKPARETRALPNDLFWTWFVDKCPPNSAVKHKEENVEH